MKTAPTQTLALEVPDVLRDMVTRNYRQLLTLTAGVSRLGQRQMVGMFTKTVVNARRRDAVLNPAAFAVAQAPTGTGKTYAYGVGVIPVALANDLKVIISVSTVALQEQLVSRDLVALASIIPGMKVALVKGRSRYVCPTRLAQQVASEDAAVREQAVILQRKLVMGEWVGDVDELSPAPDSKLWNQLTNDRNGCSGRKCSAYDRCPYYRARQGVQAANVIVVNHDLLLADVACGNAILPKLHECVLVVDEAHHLPEKALGSLSSGHALEEAIGWMNQASSDMGTVLRLAKRGPIAEHTRTVAASLEDLHTCLVSTQAAIEDTGRATVARDPSRPVRFAAGSLPAPILHASTLCLESAKASTKAVRELLDLLLGEFGEAFAPATLEQMVGSVGRALGRIERIAQVWRLMATDLIDGAPVAKWLELSGHDLRVCVSPVSVGQYLFDVLWSKVSASVHLSATVCTTGGFAPYLKACGLDRIGDVPTMFVPSPYDYASQATLVVPRNAVNPKNAQAHTEYVINLIPEAIGQYVKQGEGALFLFTSWTQLRQVLEAMPQWVKDAALTQDTLSRTEILAHHEAAIIAGRQSFIFATASFEEGVDLRGKLASLVFISKLPLSSPADPVALTLREYMDTIGLSHFSEVVIPACCRRLAQGTGRLIRSESDTGHIIVADPRLTATSFGKAILKTLPPYRLASQL